MNPMQLMQMLQQSNNPMAMMQQMAGSNPLMQRALGMAQGKDAYQLRSIAENLCKQRGMDAQQTQQYFSQFGL